MKTSSTDRKRIEKYLTGQLSPGNALLFSARLLLEPSLRRTYALHKETHALIRAYARKKQRNELNNVHNTIFQAPREHPVAAEILRLFNR